MAYFDENLMNDEKIVYRVKIHWVIFFWPVILCVLAFLTTFPGEYAIVMASISFFLAVVTGIVSFTNYSHSEFAVTNKRVLAKYGIIRKNSVDILLAKVEGVEVKQNFVGRLWGFGSVVISKTGGSKDPLHKVSEPLEFQKRLQNQIAENL